MKVRADKQKIFTIVLFAVYMLLLTGVILFKLPFFSANISDGIRVVNLVPFQGSFDGEGALVLREIIQNMLLFIPLGVYICMLKSKWTFVKKVLSIFSLSLAFEVLQFIFALGRSDITDLIDNTLGGVIGVFIYALLFKIFKTKTDKVVIILALIVTVCVIARFSQLFYLSHFVMRRMRQ